MSQPSQSTLDLRHRAGRYMTQTTGYRAFIPAPLPPVPPIQMAGEFQTQLSVADRALGRLDGSIQTLPNPDLFVFMYVRKEAVLSSQIEGTQSSLQDLLAAEAHILAPDTPADVDEVVNYVSAMNYGLERLRDILLKPVLHLSHYFKQYRTEYYEHLQAIRDHGQWEQWLLFFLRGAASVSRESTDTVRRILVLREEHRAAVTAQPGRAAGNGLRVLESLYQRPIVSVAQVQELTGTTFAAANSLVARLAKLGILQEATGYKRNRVFRYAPYIANCGDHPPATSSEFHGEHP